MPGLKMDSDVLEVECPVCDHKVRCDADRCPSCGAEFSLSGVDELQRVARELNDPSLIVEPPPIANEMMTTSSVNVPPPTEEVGAKNGLLGKWFKKKR